MINIIQHDIDRGIQSSCRRCPIARAIKRCLGWEDVVVGDQTIFNLNQGRIINRYKISSDVASFISKFDNGEDVEPFSFELGEPDVS